MHAVVANVSIEPGAQDATRRQLNDEVVPMVRSNPGFVAGYWVQLEGNRGTSVVVFDTEEHARAAAPPVDNPPVEGVKFESVEIGEVAASG